MVLVGPCSIHDPIAAMDYAAQLKPLADKHQGELVVVMRVYFEKPRTTVGWKGLISDPDLDGSFNMAKGLRVARRLMCQVNDLGLAVGTEFLNPLTARYISDLVAYGAIGARTTESQMHREMVSEMDMPVGFKNGTTGDIQIALDAMGAAKSKGSFLGNDMSGRPAVIHAAGNPHAHLILRGGSKGTNFDRESIAACEAKFKTPTPIVVDCSHGNSKKLHTNQPLVAADIAAQIEDGNRSIKGVMIESNLVAGAQKLNPGKTPVEGLTYGLSVTDACIDMDDTAKTLEVLAAAVHARRTAKDQCSVSVPTDIAQGLDMKEPSPSCVTEMAKGVMV
jgi:3-deoxy-7-phosphoheptulonate synthase